MAEGTPITPEEAAKLMGGKPAVGTPISPAEAAKLHTVPESAHAEMRKDMGWPMWAAERGIEIGGAGLGGLGGAALGAIPAIPEAATVAGIPAAAATEYAATRAGEAGGLTAADAINAKLNQWLYGRQPDITAKSLGEDYLMNLGGSVVGGAAPKVLGAAGRKIVGEGAVAQTAKVAGEEAATAAGAAKTALSAAEQEAQQKANTAIQSAQTKLAGGVAPSAEQEAVQRSIGRTPEATQRAITLPPEQVMTETGPAAVPGLGATARRQQFYGAVYGPKNRASQALGRRFDKLFADHVDRPLEAGGLGQAAQSEIDYAAQNGINYSRPVQKLLLEAQDMGSGSTGSISPQALGYTQKAWARLAPSERENILKMTQKLRPSGEAPRMTSQGIPYVSPMPQAGEAGGGTVGKLLGFRSRLGEGMVGADGPDLAALHTLRESVDDALGESGVPGAKQLRATYSGFKKDFGPDFFRTIGKVSEPSDAMKMLFDNPQRALQLASGANAEEKATLRDLYGDAVNRGVLKPDKEQAAALQAMGFRGALVKPEAWMQADQTMQRLPEMLSANPHARVKYVNSLQTAVRNARTEQSEEIVKDALKQAKSLGDAGKRITAAINAAKTPEERAQAALKAFGALDPQQEARTAGIQAIQGFKPKDTGFYSRMKNRAQISAMLGPPIMASGAMMGHPAMGASLGVGAVLLGAPIAIREGMRKAWLYSIQRSPEAAAAFYRDITNPGAAGALDRITRTMVDATVADAAAHGGKAATGVSLEKEPPSKGPGPISDAVEQRKAEQIAGARGQDSAERVDMIKDLNSEIAKGGTPEVQNDLNRGRLSTADVRKMLDANEKHDLASAFHGMSIPDAMAAFSKGSSEEKDLYLPALAQKLQDEGQGLPPQERVAILSQLKRAMQPQEGAGGMG